MPFQGAAATTRWPGAPEMVGSRREVGGNPPRPARRQSSGHV